MHRLIPFLCLLAALGGRPAPSAQPTPPVERVILISVDTLRADRLGAYGYPKPTSPVLDGFAAEGTRFATCIAASPWTLPSHASMLTGLYPERHGATHLRNPVRPEVRLLSEELGNRGFRTAAIVANDLVLTGASARDTFDHYQELPWRNDPRRAMKIVNRGAEITTAAQKWLAGLAPDDPFFLFLHYYDVHSDYDPEPRFAAILGATADRKPGTTTFLNSHRDTRAVTPDELTQMQRLYDAEIRQVDGHLGRLFDFLRQRRLWDDTLIIVTSDHGEEFREHGQLLHGRALYEETVHVPLLLRGPGVPAGRVVAALASHVDITPTILAATGTDVIERLDGISLLPLLAEESVGPSRPVFSSATHFGKSRMVRTPRFKLIDRRDQPDELYDLERDPGEQANLAAVDDERSARLMAQLDGKGALSDDDPIGQLSTADRERLRALGYLD